MPPARRAPAPKARAIRRKPKSWGLGRPPSDAKYSAVTTNPTSNTKSLMRLTAGVVVLEPAAVAMPATTTLPKIPTTSPVTTAAGAVQTGQGTWSKDSGVRRCDGGAGGSESSSGRRGGGTLDMARPTLGPEWSDAGQPRQFAQARDRPYARHRRAVAPPDEDGLDAGRPGARPVFV